MSAERPTPTAAPRFLYLHGFASGPGSYKGVTLGAHFQQQGVELERLDLRVPSLESLRLSAILDTVKAAIGGDRERVVLLGSSLGGLAACRVAERDPRVCAVVALAPAFRFIERWRARLGEDRLRAWEETGWLETLDYTTQKNVRVDFGFARDAEVVDADGGGWPDVRVPMLIVHGVRDDVVDIDVSRTFAAGKRHVRLVEVDDGHELSAAIHSIADEVDTFLRPFFGGAAR